MRKVSFLCITTDKRAPIFRDWVLFNFNKQHGVEHELVIVTDSTESAQIWPETAVVVNMRGNIPEKRNAAYAASSGDVLVWLDDDDWKNPFSAMIGVHHVYRGIAVGSSVSFFYGIHEQMSQPLIGDRPFFNSLVFHRDDWVPFNESIEVASDTEWMTRFSEGVSLVDMKSPLHFWLVHDYNISNKRQPGRFTTRAPRFGKETWRHLKKLELYFSGD
jgi:glycosyltransferase involved in cell wall biosynthesis